MTNQPHVPFPHRAMANMQEQLAREEAERNRGYYDAHNGTLSTGQESELYKQGVRLYYSQQGLQTPDRYRPYEYTMGDRLIGCAKGVVIGAVAVVSAPLLFFGCANVIYETFDPPSKPLEPDFHVDCINVEGKMSRIKYPWDLDKKVNVPEKYSESKMPLGARKADKCEVANGDSRIFQSRELTIEVRGRSLD